MMGYAVQQKRTHYVISWGTTCKNGGYGMQVVVARRAANIAAKPSNHATSGSFRKSMYVNVGNSKLLYVNVLLVLLSCWLRVYTRGSHGHKGNRTHDPPEAYPILGIGMPQAALGKK